MNARALSIVVVAALLSACPGRDETDRPPDDGASGAKPADDADPVKPEPSV